MTGQDEEIDHAHYLKSLGDRFHGISLDYRSHGTNWPAPWRVRVLATKNEREEYRVECFGLSAALAIDELRREIERIDVEKSAS